MDLDEPKKDASSSVKKRGRPSKEDLVSGSVKKDKHSSSEKKAKLVEVDSDEDEEDKKKKSKPNNYSKIVKDYSKLLLSKILLQNF